MENKKVYIIASAVLGGDDLCACVPTYSVKSTLEKAKEELENIKIELMEEYEYGNFEYEVVETENSIKFYYDNGDIDVYEIFERNIDEECENERN